MKFSEITYNKDEVAPQQEREEGVELPKKFNTATYTWEEDLKIYTYWVMEIKLMKKKDFRELALELGRTPTALSNRCKQLQNLTPDLVVKFRAAAKGKEKEFKVVFKDENTPKLVNNAGKADKARKQHSRLKRNSEVNLKKRSKEDRVGPEETMLKEPTAMIPERRNPQPDIANHSEDGKEDNSSFSSGDSLDNFVVD